MAQRDKEETEVQITETRILCVNNCGFHGNPATNNMCQSCFQATAAAAAGSPAPPSCYGRDKAARSDRARPVGPAEEVRAEEERAAAPAEDRIPKAREVKRCYGCRKRVGLTGFRCRCGEIFCGDHRYTDRHVCSFDYKAAGREAIARENPVVRAAKIVRV